MLLLAMVSFFLAVNIISSITYSWLTTHAYMSTKEPKKRAPQKFKSEETRLRQKATQFGQPNGNPRGDQSVAANQREFYRWAECRATLNELKEYVEDKNKPFARRRFCELLLANDDLDRMFALTNQTHGAPKQPIEVKQLPKVVCEVFGEDE